MSENTVVHLIHATISIAYMMVQNCNSTFAISMKFNVNAFLLLKYGKFTYDTIPLYTCNSIVTILCIVHEIHSVLLIQQLIKFFLIKEGK